LYSYIVLKRTNAKYSVKYNKRQYILLGNLQDYDPITKGKTRKRKKMVQNFNTRQIPAMYGRGTSGPGRAEAGQQSTDL
jgi:hypothetical protein